MIISRRKFLKDAMGTLAGGALLGTLTPSFLLASGGSQKLNIFHIFAYGGWDGHHVFPVTSGPINNLLKSPEYRASIFPSTILTPPGFAQSGRSNPVGFHLEWSEFLTKAQDTACGISLITEYGVTDSFSRSHGLAQAHYHNGINKNDASVRKGWLGSLIDACDMKNPLAVWGFGINEPRFFKTEGMKPVVVSSLANYSTKNRGQFASFNCSGLGDCPSSGDRVSDAGDDSAYVRYIAKRLREDEPSDIPLKEAIDRTMEGLIPSVGLVQSEIAGISLDITQFRPSSNQSNAFQTRVRDMTQAAIYTNSNAAPASLRNSTKIFCTAVGGWDTHKTQVSSLNGNIRITANAIKGLIHYLAEYGLLNQSVIMVHSEFGRTLRANGSLGTDHGGGGICMVLGGKVRNGVVGPDPDMTEFLTRNYTTPQVAFTGVLKQILTRGGFSQSCLNEAFHTFPGEYQLPLFT